MDKKKPPLANYFTVLNLFAGLLSIYFAITSNFLLSALMLIFAAIMDYLDGKVAQLLNIKSPFGKELDSLADFASFGVAPSIFGFLYSHGSIWVMCAVPIFALCGMIRLARYNIREYSNHFFGMPITTNGLIVPLIFFLGLPDILPIIYLLSAILMVSSFKFPRLP